jgi:DNA-binding NarL/FixJ family response regulator
MRTVEFASAAVVGSLFRLKEDFRTPEGERACSACREARPTAGTLGNRNLTRRELQLVDLICQAKLNKEIAYELQLSLGTVKEYLFQLFKKVGVRNRTELAILALTRTATAA